MFVKILVALGGLGLFALEIILLSPKPQKGYLITNKGDTIMCMLKRPQSSSVYFKVKNDSSFHEAGVTDIKEYHFTNKTYRALKMPNGITPVFMLLIDSGKIDLYAYHEQVGRSVMIHLFAVKEKQDTVKIFGYNERADNKLALTNLIADNQQAVNFLNAAGKYNQDIITKSIKIYNGK